MAGKATRAEPAAVGAATVLDQIRRHASESPTAPATQDLTQKLTYSELVDAAAVGAAVLTQEGVRPGDRVALYLPNCVDFVVSALACLWAGATFVPLAPGDPATRVLTVLYDCQPRLVVTAGPSDDVLPFPEAGCSFPGIPVQRLSRLPEGADRPKPPADHQAAYIIYTSGTTGTPKGVVIGQRAFATAVNLASEVLRFGASTRTLLVSPFHFDGCFGSLFPTLVAGGCAVIRLRSKLLFPRTFIGTVIDEAITYAGFSPSYLRLILSDPRVKRLADSSLATIAIGGEAVGTGDLRALWKAIPGIRVVNRYGPTETTIAVTHADVTLDHVDGGWIPLGQPHPGTTFVIVDESGTVVDQPDVSGELYIGGDQLMDGYWGAPALTAEVLREDVVPGHLLYRSGDIVHRRADGTYVYLGRADRVIKRSGVRISLVELADAVGRVPGVTSAICSAYAGPDGLGIVAFAVADRATSAADIRSGVRELLPDTMVPDRFELVDTLPLTSSSKVDERRLLADAGLCPTR